MESFLRLGLAEPLASALASFGFTGPTPAQAEAIPLLLARRDAVIESETGTGKTFAYLAPALQLVSVLERRQGGEPGVIIAAPTQELAVQIGREAERLARAAGLPTRIVVVLGGTPMEKQAAKLKEKPDIVVGTTGRLADLVALRALRTSSLKMMVLDEADRLFAPENEDLARALLKSAPSSCARVLASATIPDRVRREAGPFLRNAADVSPGGEGVLSGDIEHWCFYCDSRKRLDFARRFEAAVKPKRCLVFMSAATRIEKAALALAKLGLPIEAIHAGMDKEARRVALERFSEGKIRYLLTSDLGARGLDIPGVSHVLSLDLPEEPTIYTHRAGRTGRAGAKGVSIALADGVELGRASKIATRGGFVFRCKVLEGGEVLEPTSEEFFKRANAAEDDRLARKAARVADGARRGSRVRRDSGAPVRGAAAPRAPASRDAAPDGPTTRATAPGGPATRAPRPTIRDERRPAPNERRIPEGGAAPGARRVPEGAAAPSGRLIKASSAAPGARRVPEGAAAPSGRRVSEGAAAPSGRPGYRTDRRPDSDRRADSGDRRPRSPSGQRAQGDASSRERSGAGARGHGASPDSRSRGGAPAARGKSAPGARGRGSAPEPRSRGGAPSPRGQGRPAKRRGSGPSESPGRAR